MIVTIIIFDDVRFSSKSQLINRVLKLTTQLLVKAIIQMRIISNVSALVNTALKSGRTIRK